MRKLSTTFLSLATAGLLTTSALAQTTVSFSDNVPSQGNLVIGVFENGDLGSFGQTIDSNSNGALSHAIKAADFKAGEMSTKVIPAPMGSGYDQIMLVGLGAKGEEKSDLQWQKIGGDAAQDAVKAFKQAPSMVYDVSANATANLAYGAKLGIYYFDKYYTKESRQKSQENITIISNNDDDAKSHFDAELDPVANAIWHARDVSNEPANVIYPESFVERWTEKFAGMDNITIKVIDEKEMLEMNMGAIYGVGRGSKRPPRIMIVEYNGGNSGDNPVAIVGKGITFDTGGISIKGSNNMWNMKFDMSGAASAIGTIYALAGRGAKVNAVGVAALAENMPGGNAQRPGDVVNTMSGKTVQIRSTDAEGRLVLADGIHYTDVTYDPPLLVNLATLTGSASRALGDDYAALFSRHDELADKLLDMGKETGDELWHLPLNKNHFKAIENNVADIMNSGPSAPGASAGAAFIGAFVREETNWAHLDIAGVAYSDKAMPTKASPGSRSFGIRLLNGYIKKHYEN
ncbi:leucyl aminopeptidase [Pseudemcibacter aquimaris]|uniref:leucyl aminopeptidase n=1 Tax=Pseudemcibacter aquimaris TaxID=2857064 RepID=UPI002011E5BB|nr:leucyl aminopeptidase [Pseudemcibacter aquimaris]MCC3861206.1 leucyl aminopeptidase [Pseudemcibacter aquimaris]WDU57981.1 leucyl aminopeptidase [Pseudemcibacter aquimaris]